MDILKSLLASLDENATNKLYQYIKQKNKRKDVKNTDLLIAINTNDINKIQSLYPDAENNKSAYHAVRKRLTDITLRFIAEEILGQHTPNNSCKKYIELSHYLYHIAIPILGQKMLRKAENIAQSASDYLSLNEVYTTWLQYQKYHQHESVTLLTQKLHENQNAIIQDNYLVMAYAHLSARIQHIQLQHQPINLTDLITDTMAHYNIDLERTLTLQSIVKILDIANEYAAIYQDYSLIESFIHKVQNSLTKQHIMPLDQVQYLLQSQYYIANYYLRIKAHNVSFSYLAHMQQTIAAYPKASIDFQLKHDMLCSLNHFFIGDATTAKSILTSAITTCQQKHKNAVILQDIYACMVLCTVMQTDKAALHYLSQLTLSDLYYEQNLGMLWTIKKNLMEIIAYITFDYIELAESRITSFKRRYQQFLKQTGEERVLQYIKLIEQSLKQPDIIYTTKYQHKVHQLFEDTLEKDIFNNCFYAWLISRWSRKTPYTIMLQLHTTA